MADTIQLTPAQQAALSHDRHIVVTAGAGTGKTEVLIRRYLELLAEPDVQHINQILAMTYTEKAAREMRHRVYRALLGRSRDSATPSATRDKLQRFRDQFLSNHISTIHAFFGSVVRRFPYGIEGLDPEFTVLEGYRQRQMLRESVESLLDSAATQPDHACHEALRSLLMGRRKSSLMTIIQKMVLQRQIVEPWLRWLSASRDEQVLDHWQQLVAGQVQAALDELLPLVTEPLSQLASLEPLRAPGRDKAAQTRDAILRGVESSPAELIDTLFTSVGKPRSFSQGSKTVWGDQKNTINDCFAAIADRVLPFRSQLLLGWDENLEREALADLRELSLLVQNAMDVYQSRKFDQGVLDFADMVIFATRLLDQPEIRRVYQTQLRYIMVDEFQDTNRAQWRQIARLVEDPDQPGRWMSDKLFLVGDEKQSIYRFRGGEVEVCDEAKQTIPTKNQQRRDIGPYPTLAEMHSDLPQDGSIGFDVNFRSQPNLLYFFNRFFEPLLVKRTAYEAEAQPLYYRDRTMPSGHESGAGTVEVFRLEVDAEDEQLIALDVMDARCIAGRLRQVLDGMHDNRYPGLCEALERRERAVGFLFRRRTKQKVYEQALREYQVPYVVARGRGFFSRQEILDLSHALTAIVHPWQQIPLVGLLRSPLFAVSDSALVHLNQTPGDQLLDKLNTVDPTELPAADAQAMTKARHLIADWCAQAQYLLPSELLLHLIHSSGVLAPLSLGSDGAQRVSNVHKLVDIARRFERESSNSLMDFVDFLDSQISEDEEEGEADLPEGGGVQIMTVHQAKGLEFPLVILPDTAALFRSDTGVLIGHLDDEVQVGWLCSRDDADDQKTAVHQMLDHQMRLAAVAEEKRLLYVAQTRARDHLWLTLREPKPGKEPSELGSARSWNDWIWLRLREPGFEWVASLPTEHVPAPEVAMGNRTVDFTRVQLPNSAPTNVCDQMFPSFV